MSFNHLKKGLYALAVIFLLSMTAVAQPPSSDGPDVLEAIVPDGTGGFYVAGHTSNSTTSMGGAVVARLNPDGSTEWTLTSDADYWDLFYDVALMPDGGCVAVGASGTAQNGSFNMVAVRFNPGGVQLWQQVYPTDSWDYASCVVADPDGNIFVGGNSAVTKFQNTDVLLARLDPVAGDLEWRVVTGRDNHDYCFDIALAPDGGVMAAGYTTENSESVRDVYLVRASASGDVVFADDVDRPYPNDGHCIVSLGNGQYAIGGLTYIEESTEDRDLLLMLITDDGNHIWSQSYGLDGNDYAWDIQRAPDGGFLLAGVQYRPDRGNEGYLLRTSIDGTLEWSESYGGAGWEEFRGLAPMGDNMWAAVGFSSTDTDGPSDYYLIHSIQDTVYDPTGVTLPLSFSLNTYPNPFNPTLTVTVELPFTGRLQVKVLNSLGRQVSELIDAQSAAGRYRFMFDSQGLGSGVYFIQARVDTRREIIRRAVLVK